MTWVKNIFGNTGKAIFICSKTKRFLQVLSNHNNIIKFAIHFDFSWFLLNENYL